MKRICVYCGSSPGFDPVFMAMAKQLGELLVENNLELVYGGAGVGLMGQVADAVVDAGGVAIGVIPQSLAEKVPHSHLSELHVVDSMHERKQMMFDLSDAFIALPGGYGTLDEIFELLTWAQLGFHNKPCGLLNVDGYFDLLLNYIENVVLKGFIRQEHHHILLNSDAPETLLTMFQTYNAPDSEKWMDANVGA